MIQIWDVWYPHAAAQGLSFARGRLDATDVLLVHAAPETIDVAVRDDDGNLVAQGKDLHRTTDSPIAKLTLRGETIERRDIWPGQDDIGRPVILPGGEVGILLSWWNEPDHSAWRWRVEFSNHR